MRQSHACAWLVVLVGALAVLMLAVAGCTYNHVIFHPGSVRLADKVDIQPGQGGDASDTGANATDAATGGTGKLSPGGSNLLDGWLQMALVIQQGGETPSQTTPSVTIPASVVPGAP